MAKSDYYLCNRCGAKAFYDAHVDDPRYVGDEGYKAIDITVLCGDCAETHATAIVPRSHQEPDSKET